MLTRRELINVTGAGRASALLLPPVADNNPFTLTIELMIVFYDNNEPLLAVGGRTLTWSW